MLEQRKSEGGAVNEMLENAEHQEGESLARCSKTQKIKRRSRYQDAPKHTKSGKGADSKMLENKENQEGEALARCSKTHKFKRGEPLAR